MRYHKFLIYCEDKTGKSARIYVSRKKVLTAGDIERIYYKNFPPNEVGVPSGVISGIVYMHPTPKLVPGVNCYYDDRS